MSMFKQKVNSKSAIYRDRHILQKSRNLAYENSENWGYKKVVTINVKVSPKK